MKLAVMGQSHFGDQKPKKSDKVVFFFSISSYYIKLPDHTNHATDLKSSLRRCLGKEEK
jgi:hypothetical protein